MRRRRSSAETTADLNALPPGQAQGDLKATRKRLAPWDRIKFLLLLGLVWWLLVWALMADDWHIPFTDAMRIETRSGLWVFVLIGLEAIRQFHYLISEHSARYHRFWTVTFFGGIERVTHRRLSSWTRFRLWRAFVVIFWIAVLAVVLSKFLHTSPV